MADDMTLSTKAGAPRIQSVLIFLGVIAGFALLALFLLKVEGVSLALVAAAIAIVAAVPAGRAMVYRAVSALQARAGITIAASVVGAILLPLLLFNDSYWIHVLSMAMIFAIMAIGLNIHLGEIGLVNLGYAGLFAFGAYTSTLLTQAGVPFLLATLAAMAVCWLVGGFLGFCSARTRGDYFALVTLGFGLIVQQLIINLTWLTRGNDGITNIPAVSIFGHSSKAPIDLGFVRFVPEVNFYYLCLFSLCASAALAWRYRNV